MPPHLKMIIVRHSLTINTHLIVLSSNQCYLYCTCLLSINVHVGLQGAIINPMNYSLTFVSLDLNNLDWSKNNQVAIGLGNGVFLWNAISGSVEQLMEMSTEGDYISSLSWAANGKYLAIGGSNAAVQLWDVEKGKRLRVMKGHSDRVGVLAWNRHSLTRLGRQLCVLLSWILGEYLTTNVHGVCVCV